MGRRAAVSASIALEMDNTSFTIQCTEKRGYALERDTEGERERHSRGRERETQQRERERDGGWGWNDCGSKIERKRELKKGGERNREKERGGGVEYKREERERMN